MAVESSSLQKRAVLLTGAPGVGKTTVIVRLAELLADRPLAGFYTEEIRESGERRGFRVTTLAGEGGVLADVRIDSPHRVGRYGVEGSLERILPAGAKLLGGGGEAPAVDEVMQGQGRNVLVVQGFEEAVREKDGQGRAEVGRARPGGAHRPGSEGAGHTCTGRKS